MWQPALRGQVACVLVMVIVAAATVGFTTATLRTRHEAAVQAC